MVREQAVNHVEPFLFATHFLLMQATTSFKLPLPPPLLPQCRQIAGEPQIAPPAERKNSLDGFEGIAFRISQCFNMFQSMLDLPHAAYCGFGFLYAQLELLFDDGHEL